MISIHAPTKGATTLPRRMEYMIIISIHAPTKGATTQVIKEMPGLKFQSTLPRRERPGYSWNWDENTLFQSTLPRRERPLYPFGSIWLIPSNRYISIHAPTKGATFRIPTIHFDIMLFQSTLPRRERQCRY